MENKRYRITIEDRKEADMHIAEVDVVMAHVANKREDGLLQTETFYTSKEKNILFRMYLSLGRVIQSEEFGHISKDVGAIVDSSLFEFRDFWTKEKEDKKNNPQEEEIEVTYNCDCKNLNDLYNYVQQKLREDKDYEFDTPLQTELGHFISEEDYE